MINDPARDFEPPPRTTIARTPHELQIGYDLEDVFCAYTELPVIVTQGFPDYMLDKMHDGCGWTADRIRELGVDSALVDRFEEIVAALPGHHDFARAVGPDWLAARARTSAEMEHLIGVVRAAIDVHGLRYYDYGVMLCRVRLCVRMIHLIPNVPQEITETLPDLESIYRPELMRATAILQNMITHESPTRPYGSGQYHLDQAFAAFADYLEDWRTGTSELTDDFVRRLDELTRTVGFRGGDQAKQETTWIKHPEPLAEEDRLPLPVPHSTAEREQLESYWQAIKQIATAGDVERFLDLVRHLLDTCRRILGPVHPVTLHVHVDFAAGHSAVGRAGTATLMLLDIANTALHYYGPHHPARYLIIAHAHSFLQHWDPEQAQELYDFPLKSLIEHDEADLPPSLHKARRTILESLGVNDH
ncbi:hypothetical protein [Amycolatopsis sp. NPDC051071]|uniref:hypothetical protein n=1 Tax=Amycolatopsis sp. NPDC051071 TaxID=3154637 RepID=UPI00343028B3